MSQNHDVNFPPHARLTGYEVHKGNLTMYDQHGDAFHTKLQGHNKLNEEHRLTFTRDHHGWGVHIEKNRPGHGHGNGNGHHGGRVHVDDECAIGAVIGGIIGGNKKGSEGAIIGAGIGCAIGEIIEDQKGRDKGRGRDKPHKHDKHDKHSSLSGEDNDSVEGILKEKASQLLIGANFADQAGDPNASTSDLVESNASDITASEMGEVPVELAMTASMEMKQSASVTA